MNNFNYTLASNPFYSDEFKAFVRNMAKKGIESVKSWFASSENRSEAMKLSYSSNSVR